MAISRRIEMKTKQLGDSDLLITGDCSDHVVATALFVSSPSGRTGDPAILPGGGTWRNCLFANGLRLIDQRDDAGTRGRPPDERLEKSRRRVSGTKAVKE